MEEITVVMQWRFLQFGALAVFVGLFGSELALCQPAPAPSSEITHVDLVKPFKTRSPWRLVVVHGPAAVDFSGSLVPGALRLCLEKGSFRSCASDSGLMLPPQGEASYRGWEPHYLIVAKPVYPQGRSARPLLLIKTASMHGVDGGQFVLTQLLEYVGTNDKFERVYARTAGTNNNQEVRFISDIPLEGAVISAEPTGSAPFAYWIEVSKFTSEHTYRQVLRYRSATHYNDGNSLPVIDSEMPNIEQRLDLWKPGSPLPLLGGAVKGCLRPHLKNSELWCN